jgi:hypothetical protein
MARGHEEETSEQAVNRSLLLRAMQTAIAQGLRVATQPNSLVWDGYNGNIISRVSVTATRARWCDHAGRPEIPMPASLR